MACGPTFGRRREWLCAPGGQLAAGSGVNSAEGFEMDLVAGK